MFSLVDVIAALTDTDRPSGYWTDLKSKMAKIEGFDELYDNIGKLPMPSADGKMRPTEVANTETLFRIIQSIPSPKAEPVKLILAQSPVALFWRQTMLLSERVEALTGPDREIDALIESELRRAQAYAVGLNDKTRAHWEPDSLGNVSSQGCTYSAKAFTTSLDAAMTLVPDGWWLQHLGQCLGGWRVRIETNGPPSKSIGVGFGAEQPTTPALALTAAALKARGL